MDVFGFLGPLVTLLLLGAIVAGIVMVIRRGRDGTDEYEPGIGTTRRIFLYGLAFVALMLATTGVTLLISSILNSIFETRIGGGDTTQTAFGLAATIVGFPTWALLWRAGNKSLETHPSEAGTLGRKFYTYLVVMVAAIVVAITGTQTLRDILGWEAQVSGLAAPIVWSVVWLFHWRIEAAEGQPTATARTVRRLYVYITSAYGLVMLAMGTGFVVHGLLANAYAAIFQDSIVGIGWSGLWTDDSRTSLALALIGGAYWGFHWHRAAANDHGSEFGVATIYVLGIFGGIVTAISGVSIAVFTLLKWLFGRGDSVSAVEHFDTFPAAIAVTIVGVAVWFYHRALAEEDAAANPGRATSGRRVYRYLSSAVGLLTASVGIAVLIAVVIGFVTVDTGSIIRGSRWWGTPLAAALTSILVGAPLWARSWVLQQMPLDAADPSERVTQSRRAYMFIIFGLSVLATLISGSVVLYQVIEAALDGRLRTETFDDVRYGLGVVLTAAIVSFYHWQVLREDRAVEETLPAEEEVRARMVRMTAAGVAAARPLARAIAERAGATLTFWTRSDDAGAPTLTDELVSETAQRVSNVRGDNVLITIDGSGVQVIPL